MTRRLTVEQIGESIERGDDDSASEFEDEIELRNLTEDEEEREVVNYDEHDCVYNDEACFAQPLTPGTTETLKIMNLNSQNGDVFNSDLYEIREIDDFLRLNTFIETNSISSSTNNTLTQSETFEMFDDNNADSSPAQLIIGNFYILDKI